MVDSDDDREVENFIDTASQHLRDMGCHDHTAKCVVIAVGRALFRRTPPQAEVHVPPPVAQAEVHVPPPSVAQAEVHVPPPSVAQAEVHDGSK